MPPRLIVALCTGPVTMPWQVPTWQADAARASASITAPALRGSAWPGTQETGAGMETRRSSPAAATLASGAISVSGRPRRVAAPCSVAGSPKPMRSAAQSRCAARTHSSGPTPAGSPGTSASRGRDMSAAVAAGLCVAQADVDICFAAHLAHVAVPLVFQLALADRLADLRAPVVVAGAGLARGDALHDVPAGLGPEGRRDLPIFQRRDLAAELGAELVLREPAQVAAFRLADRVIGTFARDFLEIGAARDTRTQAVDPCLGIAIAAGALGRADQDVAGAVLGYRGAACSLVALARVHQLQQLEAARPSGRADHVARRHGADRVGERHRDFIEAAPAQAAAFEGVGTVGIAHRSGCELDLPAVEQA